MVHLIRSGALYLYRGKIYTLFGDSDSQVRQKEVSDMLIMISYAEERGEKEAKNVLGCL